MGMTGSSGSAFPPTTGGVDGTGAPTSSTTALESSTGDEQGHGSSSGEPAPCSGIGPEGWPGSNSSSIWIANAGQSTLSKIDTATLVEQGRYLTRGDAMGDPSRTAVSLDGDVVVANRAGGLTKFHGEISDCVDLDNNGAISTSSDGTIVPWDQEECRAWHLPFAYSPQIPVAWTAGTFDEDSCEYVGEKIWTSGVTMAGVIEVVLVDGETGVYEQTVQIPEINAMADPTAGPLGLFGAAVDAENNLWASMFGLGFLVRISRQDLELDYWPMPISGYGMTLGPSGFVFVCSGASSGSEGVTRFDPATETWLTAPNVSGSGCVEDGMGRLWVADDPLVAIDVTTLAIVETIDLPEYVNAVAVDFDGMVWGVGHGESTNAYRVEPATGTFNLFGELFEPYAYSNMTGFVLASVAQ